jgi:hypothetical protein
MKYAIKQSQFGPTIIVHLENNWFIPADPANSDYQQYLAWVAEGNTAEEWSPDAN